MHEYESRLVAPGVYDIVDRPGMVDMYLILGRDRALLLDAGDSRADLAAEIRGLTALPVSLVISHAHPDHTAAIGQFPQAYMAPADRPLLRTLFGPGPDTPETKDLQDGDRFDLGGRSLDVLTLAGHTPGSVALLDRENRRLFLSDAVGTGELWMHVPGCLPLSQYYSNLLAFRERLAGLDALDLYLGHRVYSGQTPGLGYLDAMARLVGDVLGGRVRGEPFDASAFGSLPGARVARSGPLALRYDERRL